MALLDQPHKALQEILAQLLAGNELYSAVLSDASGSEATSKITLRPITTRQGLSFQASEQRGKQVFQRNIVAAALADFVVEEFTTHFHQLVFFSAQFDYHFRRSHKGKISLTKSKPSHQKPSLQHNRAKPYLLPEGQPIDFLVKLNVMAKNGQVLSAKSDKFRQINRFLEIIDELLASHTADQPLHIIDFGCGKAYLTFALYYYLRKIRGINANLTGLDLKKDVIAFCTDVAVELGYEGLHFEVGDIATFTPKGPVDMVICLHACDTATDAALEKAVSWNAETILAVPCCQHELYSQLENSLLKPLLRHGILRERFAALVTDAARAHLLELVGYRCQIIEFIDLEHTPKNLLIRAVRRSGGQPHPAGQQEYRAFADALHINPALERALFPRHPLSLG